MDAEVLYLQMTSKFPSWQEELRLTRRCELALRQFNLRVSRSSRNVMKITHAFATLAVTGSGEIERPVEKSRPTSWLVRRVRC